MMGTYSFDLQKCPNCGMDDAPFMADLSDVPVDGSGHIPEEFGTMTLFELVEAGWLSPGEIRLYCVDCGQPAKIIALPAPKGGAS